MNVAPSIRTAIAAMILVWFEGWDEMMDGPDPLFRSLAEKRPWLALNEPKTLSG